LSNADKGAVGLILALELASLTGVEWNYSGIEGFDNKMENNLSLSSCVVPRSAVMCVVAYFRRTELLSGVLERSGID